MAALGGPAIGRRRGAAIALGPIGPIGGCGPTVQNQSSSPPAPELSSLDQTFVLVDEQIALVLRHCVHRDCFFRFSTVYSSDEAKIGGITPEVLSLSGRCEDWPSNI
jgi:hypothetical protein